MDIRRCTVAELEAAHNWPELLDAYARESSMQEIGAADPQMDKYRRIEAAGVFHVIAAFDGALLLGFITIVVGLLHYQGNPATVESFFVSPGARALGLGLKLRRAAEALARELGAPALLIIAKVGGPLDKVMARSKHYRHSNNVFVRALA